MMISSIVRPAARFPLHRVSLPSISRTKAASISNVSLKLPIASSQLSVSCSYSEREFHLRKFPSFQFKLPLPKSASSPSSSPYSHSTLPSRHHHIWHKSSPNNADLLPEKLELAVVLLGWLGAESKHLRKYAEWYNSRGIHAITFVMPIGDLLRFNVIERTDEHVESLYVDITEWLSRESEDGKEKTVMFHTFSNTGWFTYGAILEKLLKQGKHFLSRIRGCVVDSGPAAQLSPQVWASGFATAVLKKQSFSTKSVAGLTEAERAISVQPSMSEVMLLAVLEKFFSLLLSLPIVKQRLLGIISILSNAQPPCPQLYIYSTADRVIPASYVESFIAQQKQRGYKVSFYNMQLSPHVDHFRSFPVLYCQQLERFIRDCLHEKSLEMKRQVPDC